MIPYKIFPMFHLGFLHINFYGIMFALGALLGLFLAKKEAKRRGIREEVVESIALYALIGGIIGARLFYVLFYWPAGTPMGFFDAFKIWEGGMAFFGGFLGGLTAAYIYIKKHNLNFWIYADILAISLVAGHILGRVGDYLTGGHPGKITNLPWVIYMDGAMRHPVVLYELIGLLIIFAILWNLRKVKSFEGFIFALYIGLYSIQRIFLDYFRIESTDPRFLGLTPSQFVSIALLAASIFFIGFKIKNLGNKITPSSA